MQYNDSVAQSTLTGAVTTSSIVSISESQNQNNNYQPATKMSNKFITGKLGLLYASAKGQPVRARTNMDKYSDGPISKTQDQQHFYVPSSASVTTIQMPPSHQLPQ